MKVSAAGVTYEFDENRMLNVELMAIERKTGMTALDFQNGMMSGSMVAATALIWILRKRKEPQLQFEDVEFEASSFEMVQEEEEGKDELSGNPSENLSTQSSTDTLSNSQSNTDGSVMMSKV